MYVVVRRKMEKVVSRGKKMRFEGPRFTFSPWMKLELGRTGMEKFIVDGGEVSAQKKMLAFYFRFTRQEKMVVRLL